MSLTPLESRLGCCCSPHRLVVLQGHVYSWLGGWAPALQLPGQHWHFLGAGQESSAGPLADSKHIMAEVAAWIWEEGGGKRHKEYSDVLHLQPFHPRKWIFKNIEWKCAAEMPWYSNAVWFLRIQNLKLNVFFPDFHLLLSFFSPLLLSWI